MVVGGGSAGCVLAARLSEDPTQHVVLLEAGPDWRASEAPPQLRSLNGWRTLDESACAAFQWRGLESRRTRAQETRPHLRGRDLGGGSTVNGMMAIRAVPDDYDRWALPGCPGWSYADNAARVTTHDAYLDPARERTNLQVLGGATVDRVLVEAGRAATCRS